MGGPAREVHAHAIIRFRDLNQCQSCPNSNQTVTVGALGLTQGFVISFHVNSTGRLAILMLLSSQASNKKLEELLKRNVQNLYVRSSAPPAVL